LVPDLVAYTRGLQACAQLGDVRRAEAIVSAMHLAGLAWQDNTLTSVMNVYAKVGLIRQHVSLPTTSAHECRQRS
jgi:hypothetical protein